MLISNNLDKLIVKIDRQFVKLKFYISDYLQFC